MKSPVNEAVFIRNMAADEFGWNTERIRHESVVGSGSSGNKHVARLWIYVIAPKSERAFFDTVFVPRRDRK